MKKMFHNLLSVVFNKNRYLVEVSGREPKMYGSRFTLRSVDPIPTKWFAERQAERFIARLAERGIRNPQIKITQIG